MTVALYFFVPLAVVAAVLCNIGIWSPRRFWLKVVGLGAATAFMPLAYGALADLLSRPKPVSIEWVHRHAPEATVLGSTMREGEAIYLWIKMQGMTEPRAYKLPWSRQLAQQLQDARRESEKNRSGVKVRMPFEPSEDRREKMFYSPPQQALPEKPIPQSDKGYEIAPPQGQI